MRQWFAILGFVVTAVALGTGHWLASAGVLIVSFWLWRHEDSRPRQPAVHRWAEGDPYGNSGFSLSLLDVFDVLDLD